jgi:hypothetical protein
MRALVLGYRDHVDASLTANDRLVIRHATAAYGLDTALLRQNAVVAAYGDDCGRDAISVALRVNGRSPREASRCAALIDGSDRFHSLVGWQPGAGGLRGLARR